MAQKVTMDLVLILASTSVLVCCSPPLRADSTYISNTLRLHWADRDRRKSVRPAPE